MQNCTAKSVLNAVFSNGSLNTLDSFYTITQNSFGSTIAAEKLSLRGILLQFVANASIDRNTVFGVTTATTNTVTGILVNAINYNVVIERNNVYDVSNTNTTGYGANGIYSNTANTNANLRIANNFISGVRGYGYASGYASGDNGYGIMVEGAGTGISLLHNTVRMNVNQTLGFPGCLNVGTTTPANAVTVRNNIFANETTVGTRYAVVANGSTNPFLLINHNSYSAQNVGRFNATDRTTLAAWQAAIGQDANSVTVLPTFAGANNLHLTSSAGLQIGPYLAAAPATTTTMPAW